MLEHQPLWVVSSWSGGGTGCFVSGYLPNREAEKAYSVRASIPRRRKVDAPISVAEILVLKHQPLRVVSSIVMWSGGGTGSFVHGYLPNREAEKQSVSIFW